MSKRANKRCDFKHLSQQETAEAIGVTDRTLRDWEPEGFPRNPDGSYSLPECIKWVVSRETGGGGLVLDNERARLAKEQADKIALENSLRRGEVADLKTIGEELAKALTSFRARLLAAPSKLAPRVNPENPNLARDIISGELERILAELAAYQPGASTPELHDVPERPAADPASPAETDDKRVGGRVPKAKSRK